MSEQVGQAMISAVGLTKEFRDFWGRPKAKAVNDIDFEVNPGEVVGLLGPNGSGKSTTVKIILGLLYQTAGVIKVLGRSPREVAVKKSLGYLPEESYLYKYLSAFETLDFFGALFDLSKSERQRRAEQLLRMVGLEHARDRAIGEFSKGMARRVGLAQAMINDPDLLILDEPTSGLDPIGCREVKNLIKHLKSRGKTVLVTSHLLSDVEDVCDRVIILYGGKIRATGTLDELLKVPEESRITTPMLSPKATEKVIAILRENLQGENFIIDHPRKSLEDFFLDVVAQAKSESLATAGAADGGEIANYLVDDEKSGILKQLAKDEPPPPRPTSAEAADSASAADKSDKAAARLNKLVATVAPPQAITAGQSPPAAETAPPLSGDSPKDEKLDKANEKLKNLLG